MILLYFVRFLFLVTSTAFLLLGLNQTAKSEQDITVFIIALSLTVLAIAIEAMLVRSTNIGEATLELYQIDLEMLFSKDPFLTDSALRTRPAISPNSVIQLKPAPGKRDITVGIPKALRKGNLLVSAESGDLKTITILDSRALELRHTPLDRTVQVLDPATSKPLPKTYIKVYAEDQNGNIEFHKDGYTDLRGKFDYLSHTATNPAKIKRLALLISHPEKGARTIIYDR